MNAVLDEAARLNSPVIGELPDLAPLVSLTDVTGTIVLDWVKLADDGSDDLIVRLYEAAGGNAAAALRLDAALADAKASVQEVNLMEEPELDAELRARSPATSRCLPTVRSSRWHRSSSPRCVFADKGYWA